MLTFFLVLRFQCKKMRFWVIDVLQWNSVEPDDRPCQNSDSFNHSLKVNTGVTFII